MKRSGVRLCDGANIGNLGQNKRLRVAAVILCVALVLTTVLVKTEVDRLWRLVLVLPFFFASLGAYQGLYKA